MLSLFECILIEVRAWKLRSCAWSHQLYTYFLLRGKDRFPNADAAYFIARVKHEVTHAPSSRETNHQKIFAFVFYHVCVCIINQHHSRCIHRYAETRKDYTLAAIPEIQILLLLFNRLWLTNAVSSAISRNPETQNHSRFFVSFSNIGKGKFVYTMLLDG